MHIDWTHFTPGASFAGGLLIGIAACACALLLGRIAGVSGIVGALLRPERGEISWRLAFVAGMLASPLVYALFAPLPEVRIAAPYGVVILGGLLVGLGASYGSGCTSGHGVCGISRRSARSIVATGAFMVAGFLVVFLVRHVFVR